MRLSTYLTRLIWWSLLPLVVFIVWLVYANVRAMLSENDKQSEQIAHNFATAIDYHLDARIGALNVLARSSLGGNPAQWPELYREAQAFHQNFQSHVILASTEDPMRMLFNTRLPYGASLPVLPRPAGRAAAPAAIATRRAAVGDVFFGPIAREPLVAIATPMLKGNEVSQVLLASFETRLFQERIEKISLPAGWRLSLLDSLGNVIARQPVTGQDFDIYRKTLAPLKAAPWSVVMEIPREIYLAPVIGSAMALALGAGVALLVGVGGGLWGTRRLGKAVTALAQPEGTTAEGPVIAEIDATRQLIEASTRRIAGFATAQEKAIEEERRRVAREVHDQMGQVFSAIRLIVQSVPRAAYPPGQEAALQQALDLGIASARKITAELRPPLLDDLGLAVALQHFANETSRTTGLDVIAQVDDCHELSTEQALGLYRIVQEAMTNIQRHARARKVAITGQRDADFYHLVIEDDGCGFDPGQVRAGAMGLTNMQERAHLMHGQCVVTSGPAGGTRVAVSLPFDKTAATMNHEHPAG